MSGGRFRFPLTSGVTIAGEDRGRADAPAIVLLHGLASTRRWWDLVAARLTAANRVVRLDHRGHGESSTPGHGYSVARLAADTAEVIDRLGLPAAVVAGHSLGGAVALTVAAERPDLAAAAACVDGGVYDPTLMFGATWNDARPVMVRARRGYTTLAVLEAWLQAAGLPAAALPIVAANYTDGGPGGLRLRLRPEHEAELARSLWALDPIPLLDAARGPVLAIAARQDEESEDAPRRESIRRARLRVGRRLRTTWIAGGHDLPLQRPDEVAATILSLAAATAR